MRRPESIEGEEKRSTWRAFAALSNPGYRWYFISGMGMTAAMGFEQLALAWLILDLTGSLAQLGLVVFVRGVPMVLLSLFGGVMADRYSRRRMLMANQFVSVLNMAGLATLVLIGNVEVWHVLASSILLGATSSLTAPARQAMIRGLVGGEHLINAVTLNSMQQNASRILWPMLAGALIAIIGSGGALLGCAVGYLVGFVFLVPVPDAAIQKRLGHNASPISDLVEGVRYTFTTPMLGLVMTLMVSTGVFGLTLTQIGPGFGREIMKFNEFETGLFLMASGVGALIGSVSLLLFEFKKLTVLLFTLSIGFGLSMIALALNPYYAAAFFLMGCFGFIFTTMAVVAQTLFQMIVPQNYLGRVSSILMLAPSLGSVMTLPVGVVGEELGLRWTVGTIGLVLLFMSLAGVARLRHLDAVAMEASTPEPAASA